MSFLDIFKIGQIKEELERLQFENRKLQRLMSETGRFTLDEIQRSIKELTNTRDSLSASIVDLKQQIYAKQQNIIIFDDELLLQSYGLYQPRYDLKNSEQYRDKLEEIRQKQTVMVKNNTAACCSQDWTVNGSRRDGERMIKDYLKLILRSFNNECDASIINVKYNNVESIEKRIRKSYETLNNLGSRMNIAISSAYFHLKLEELYLCYEYSVKKQEEKEEQKRIREEMREEAKVLKEIEEARLRIEKEENHFTKALSQLDNRLSVAVTDEERQAIEEKKHDILEQLELIDKKKKDIDYREQNTRAGYVYVISNIGSFGDHIFKIGVTRRLDPTERIDELGDASVPFNFDIHALIFSNDAPKLEGALHKAFEHRKLNLINNRREFFKATLTEIEQVVKANFDKAVEFVEIAEAPEFRQSVAMRQNMVKAKQTVQ